MAALLLTYVYPLMYAGYFSLFHETTTAVNRYVGLGNYETIFADSNLPVIVENTLIFAAGSAVGQFLYGLVVALGINRVGRGGVIFRVANVLPWALPGVVTGLMWRWMLEGVNGIFTDTVMKIGLVHSPIMWLSNPDWTMIVVIIVNIWRGFPFYWLSLLAVIRALPADLFEAASIDGASTLQKFRNLTVPLMRPIIIISLAFGFIWAANYLDLIFILTMGGPAMATMTFVVYGYYIAFRLSNLGLASAYSVITTLSMSCLSIPLAYWLSKTT